MIIEDFLKHHGIKGQKWGIRNNPKLVKKYRKHVGKTIKIGIGAAYIATLLAGSGHRSSNILDKNLTIHTVNINSRPKVNKNVSDIFKNLTTKVSAAEVIRMQEKQRNGAFQIAQYLKRNGTNIV